MLSSSQRSAAVYCLAGWLLAFAALIVGLPLEAAAQTAPLDATLREEIVMVRKGSGLLAIELETTIFRPPGAGPFPVVIINHGKAPGNPRFQARARYETAARAFLQRGYMVVVPMRQGFSRSTGSYIGGGCNVEGNGRAQADDVVATLDYVRGLSDADSSRVVVIGQSHGGLTTMALGARALPGGVRALINFAGGLRNENCTAWEGSLVSAMGAYGRTARLPTLWFYGSNDSYWTEPLAREMHARYVAAGGSAQLVAFGAFGSDAHQLFASRNGLAVWLPQVDAFLASLGLPTQPVLQIERLQHEQPVPATSDAFDLNDVAAIPHVGDAAREGYRKFLAAAAPRAFAVADTGAWAWAANRRDAMNFALERCAQFASAKGGSCRLYAVDDQIVWPAGAADH